jgi:hypothetical protein
MKQVVEMWDSHRPITGLNFQIRLGITKPIELPEEVKEAVSVAWAKNVEKNPKARDNQVAFLHSYFRLGPVDNPHSILVDAFYGSYSVSNFLNRDPEAEKFYEAAKTRNVLASWILPICGEYALFGYKTNFPATARGPRVSAFGGFSSVDDEISNEICKFIVAEKHIERKIREEIGQSLVERIEFMRNIGLQFMPFIGTRGFDLVYITELDATSEQIQAHFVENPQFKREIISVKAEPKDLIEFLNRSGIDPTTSCVGGVMNFICSKYGPDELARAIRSYEGEIKVVPRWNRRYGPVQDRI